MSGYFISKGFALNAIIFSLWIQKKQSKVEVTYLPQEEPKLWSEESEEHQEEQSVFEKYAPWNEQLLNPWEKDPLEWNPWESNNDVSNNDPWSNPNDPFNNNNGW